MPTTSYSVTESAWQLIGAAPCGVECKSVQPTCLYVGTSMPSLNETGFTVLRNDDPDGFSVTASGNNVYARAFNQQSNGAVYPIAAPGGGSGGASTITPSTGSQEQDVRNSQALPVGSVGATLVVPLNGQGTVGFTFTGLAASGATLAYEQSNDGGTTWTGKNATNVATGAPESTRTTDGQIRVGVAGHTHIRLRVATAGAGSVTVASNISVRPEVMALAAPLPPGTNRIGTTAVEGIPNGEPQRIVPAQLDNVATSYTLTATGPQPGIRTTGYASAHVELMGTFVGTVSLQGSSDSTDGIDGTWTTLIGPNPEDAGSVAPANALTNTRRRLRFTTTDPWVRVNVTAFTSGPILARVVLRTAPIGERGVYVGNLVSTAGAATFIETFRTALAASAIVTGTSRDATATPIYSKFGVAVVTDQAGSLQIQMSTNNTDWITAATQAVTANTPIDLSLPIRARYYRAVYTNGATATGATAFSLLTSYTAA